MHFRTNVRLTYLHFPYQSLLTLAKLLPYCHMASNVISFIICTIIQDPKNVTWLLDHLSSRPKVGANIYPTDKAHMTPGCDTGFR